MANASVFLIDGHALCYRAFFAVRDLRNSRGQPTNAVFGFLNILRKLRRDFSPGYMAVCFDVSKITRRHQMYSEYKGHRQTMPEDLALQIPVIHALLRAYRIPVFEKEGIEADDVLATMAEKFSSDGYPVVIVTDDKDMFQLVNEHVRVYSSRREVLMGPDEVEERFGVEPRRVVDYLALIGDASDNIPGVDGVGEVTAKNLIREFGGLDDIYQNIGRVKGKVKDKLEHGRPMAFLSRELALLDRHIPLSLSLNDLAVIPPDKGSLDALFKELEFRGFADESGVTPNPEPPGDIFLGTTVDEGLVSSDLGLLADTARAAGHMAIHFLFDDTHGHLVTREFVACADGKIFRAGIQELSALKDVLSDAQVRKICYGLKDLYKECLAREIQIGAEFFDVFLVGYLLRSGRSGFTVSDLARTYLNQAVETDLEQVQVLFRLADPLQKALVHEGLYELYVQVECPLALVLAGVEMEGVRIDRDLLGQLSKECDLSIGLTAGKIYALAGQEFNCNSPKQLGHVLFEVLKLPVVKRTKTGFSTDEEVLTRLSSRHDLPALVLEYRGLAKLKSTYIDALPRMADPLTGRVHCLFDQAGAETGRLSSQRPNLQNIPVRTEFGRRIRGAFIPSNDQNLLLAADYSQIELRVLAHLADEQNMKMAFSKGEDIHAYTAGLMFDVPLDQVTREMRYNAKRINFGIVYGMSAFGLAKDLGVPQKEAQDFIDRYFHRYPGIRYFMDNEIEKARAAGYVETMFHRRRYLPDINSKNQAVRQFAERQAVNSPVQGAAADLIKMSMVRLGRELSAAGLRGRMIMTVHDELVFDVPREELSRMAALVRSVMSTVHSLSVPLDVTVKAGENWAEMANV